MWKIYVILTLSCQTLNIYCDVFITNSRGGGGGVNDSGGKSVTKLQNVFIEYTNNYNTHIDDQSIGTASNSTYLFSRMYNTNSRDSFPSTNEISKNQTLYNIPETNNKTTQLKTNTPLVNNTPTTTSKSPVSVFDRNLNSTTLRSGESFHAKLFDIMTTKAKHGNLVYSPFSLQTILAFISMMSSGKLYDELVQLLAIPNDRVYVAEKFEEILNQTFLNTPPTTLIMANKLYYDYRFGTIDNNVRNSAIKSYKSELEPIDFFASQEAAKTINSWISEKTRNLIQDIVTPSTISGDTSALLLNSLYFKSEWLTKFDIYDTKPQDFYTSSNVKTAVDMMHNEDVFRYGDFPDDLQASVVELPYKTNNLSMLLLLPKDIEGLEELERKLRYHDFAAISERLKRELVTIKLPKFKIEFEIDMIKPLKTLGLNALFNNDGSINVFRNQQKPLNVDQFKHKSFIDVNEAGTEAAAATVAKYIPLSIQVHMKYFTADHPFVFVIRDSSETLFIGHVVKI